MLKYIEETEKHYRVRCRAKNKLIQKSFNFSKYGGKKQALKAAIQYRNVIFKNNFKASHLSKDEFLKWLDWFISEFDINSGILTKTELFEEIKINLPENF